MDDRLSRIENKIDRIEQHLSEIKVTSASQHEVLQEHIRRTEANEEAVSLLHRDLKPIKTHIEFIRGLGKFTVTVFVILSSLVAILTFIIPKFH